MGRIILDVDNLERTFGGKVPTYALRGVSFNVMEGEFVAVMGKSGSGKTTLLRCLGLLDKPTGGSIDIKNEKVSNLTDAQKRHFRLHELGYVFQDYAVLFELTALENVYLPMLVDGKMSRQECKNHGMEILKKVGLEDRAGHYQDELSGGEQQRVAIARALSNSPKILFADEPCANLDSVGSEKILQLLYELNKKIGVTIIMVSHEPEDKKWVDRVIWMKDGRIDRKEKLRKAVKG